MTKDKEKSKMPKWVKILLITGSIVTAITVVIPFMFDNIKPLNDLKQGITKSQQLWQWHQDSMPDLHRTIKTLQMDLHTVEDDLLDAEDEINKLEKSHIEDSVDFNYHLIDYYILKDKVNRNH